MKKKQASGWRAPSPAAVHETRSPPGVAPAPSEKEETL